MYKHTQSRDTYNVHTHYTHAHIHSSHTYIHKIQHKYPQNVEIHTYILNRHTLSKHTHTYIQIYIYKHKTYTHT